MRCEWIRRKDRRGERRIDERGRGDVGAKKDEMGHRSMGSKEKTR